MSTSAVCKAYIKSLLARTLFLRGDEFANISESSLISEFTVSMGINSCAVTEHLIYDIVFTNVKSGFSPDMAHIDKEFIGVFLYLFM